MALLLRVFNFQSNGLFSLTGSCVDTYGEDAFAEHLKAVSPVTAGDGVLGKYSMSGGTIDISAKLCGDLFNTKNQSIAFWVKAFPSSGWQWAFGQPAMQPPNSRGYTVFTNYDTNGIHVGCQSDNVTTQSWVTDISNFLIRDSWNHVCLTMDNGIFRSYSNGVLIQTDDFTGWTKNWSSCTTFPLIHPSGNYIDDIRIYNHPLSQEEIAFLVKAPHYYMSNVHSELLNEATTVTARISNKWGNINDFIEDRTDGRNVSWVEDSTSPCDGGYYDFNGVDSFITIDPFLHRPTFNNNMNGWTITFWAYKDIWTNADNAGKVEDQIMFSLALAATGSVPYQRFVVKSNGVYGCMFTTVTNFQGPYTLTPGWHLFTIALKSDKGTSLRIDNGSNGTASSGSGGGVESANNSWISIGGTDLGTGYSNQNFKGRITGLRIYGSKLTIEQINEIYYKEIEFTPHHCVDAKSVKKQEIYNFYYTGQEQVIILEPGRYKFEAWGAAGGGYNGTPADRALGGYSSGIIKLERITPIYVYVGQQGRLLSNVEIFPAPSFNAGVWTSNTIEGGFAAAPGGATDFRLCNRGIEWSALSSYSCLYPDIDFASGVNGISPYGNVGDGSNTVTRIAYPDADNTSKYALEIKKANSAGSDPYWGGFHQAPSAAAFHILVHVFRAKVPKGMSLSVHTNALGNNATLSWITPTKGTDTWEDYAIYCKCGNGGSFGTIFHIACGGIPVPTATNPLKWYVCKSTVYDCGVDASIENIVSKLNNSLKSRILVAGGGGVFEAVDIGVNHGGAGGGLVGGAGTCLDVNVTSTPQGGSQTAGGTSAKSSTTVWQTTGGQGWLGIGGSALLNPSVQNNPGAPGGGGWYGGGGVSGGSCGSGGGSSYISGYPGCRGLNIDGNTFNDPSNGVEYNSFNHYAAYYYPQTAVGANHYSYYFAQGEMKQGVHPGTGKARITKLS